MKILENIGKGLLLFISMICVVGSSGVFTPAVFLSFAFMPVAGVIAAYGHFYFAIIMICLSSVAISVSPIRDILFVSLNSALLALGACPRIESLLRKSHFGPFFCSFSLNMSNYSPQMIKKMDSKWLPLATASILGQAPSACYSRLWWSHVGYIQVEKTCACHITNKDTS